MNWENCVGLCSDGIQSMSGRNSRLKALVRKKVTRIIWTNFMLYGQALPCRDRGEELQTVFNAVIGVFLTMSKKFIERKTLCKVM
jgi:hypothetical protein